ncbi:LmeA family phospholipid-binding protein [Microbacterium elymi]|uniref:LmeA family phospholipid-binding protein n=1 Tax=Microbacterium elymi TaxID=2909587 RepID=UPI00338E05C2
MITGALDELTVTVPDAPLGKTTGTVTVHATGVPVSGDAPARSVDASVKLAPDAIAKLAGDLGRTVPGSLKVDGGNVVVELDPSQFLSGVSFGLTLKPSAKDGQLVLTPVAFDVGGASMSADTIRARFGSLADGILAPRRVCVASAFPSGLTLSKIAVDSAAVTADFAVDPRILSDPALQKPGKCP